jgi:ankyrin repeat protein
MDVDKEVKRLTDKIVNESVKHKTSAFLTSLLKDLESITDADDDNIDDKKREREKALEKQMKEKSEELGLQYVPTKIQKFGYSELHKAVVNEDYDLVVKLVEAGASLTAKDNGNNTPLDKARKLGLDKIASFLEKECQKQ